MALRTKEMCISNGYPYSDAAGHPTIPCAKRKLTCELAYTSGCNVCMVPAREKVTEMKVVVPDWYMGTKTKSGQVFAKLTIGMCAKCLIRAKIVMETSDHLAVGEDVYECLDRIEEILTDGRWGE